jgi:hypothetical protein
MDKKEIIKKLDELSDDDPEQAHIEADGILLAGMDPEIKEAYLRAQSRITFWYS